MKLDFVKPLFADCVILAILLVIKRRWHNGDDALLARQLCFPYFCKIHNFRPNKRPPCFNRCNASNRTSGARSVWSMALEMHPCKLFAEAAIENADERKRRKKERVPKTATRRLRLPGKLADCLQVIVKWLSWIEGDLPADQQSKPVTQDTVLHSEEKF